MGYGDVTPATPLARTLAWIEAITGQFYLAVLVAGLVGVDVPFNNYVTGYSAFTHKAGIHAKAILNAPETYEALDPHDFGLTRYISIAHRLTGWNAVKARADQLDLALTDDQIKALTQHIKALADERMLTLDDVDALLKLWANGQTVSDFGLPVDIAESAVLEPTVRASRAKAHAGVEPYITCVGRGPVKGEVAIRVVGHQRRGGILGWVSGIDSDPAGVLLRVHRRRLQRQQQECEHGGDT